MFGQKQYLFSIVVALLLPFSAAATHQESEGAGPAFSDPDGHFDMAESWQKRPLEYEDWAKGADLAISLDQHLYPVFKPMIQQFARQKGMTIALQEGTCGISAGGLQRKSIDIGGFCCPPGLSDRLPGLEYVTVGVAPLGILVSRDNPVTNLTPKEVGRIFAGHIRRWNQIADPAVQDSGILPVRPVTRLHCKNRPGHWRLILDNEEMFGSAVTEVGNIQDMMATVAARPDTIGYEVLWNIESHNLASEVKALDIGGVSPNDAEAMVENRYPYYRTYNISLWKERPAEVDELIDYLFANMEKALIRHGIVPIDKLKAAGWSMRGKELIGESPL